MKGKKDKKEKRRFYGYFLMDSGTKVDFDIAEYDEGERFKDLYDEGEFNFGKGETILVEGLFILVDRIIGFTIDEYYE